MMSKATSKSKTAHNKSTTRENTSCNHAVATTKQTFTQSKCVWSVNGCATFQIFFRLAAQLSKGSAPNRHLTGVLCRQPLAMLDIVMEQLFKVCPAYLFEHITNLLCLATSTNACCAVYYRHYWELIPAASSLSIPFQTSRLANRVCTTVWPPQ